MSVAGTTLILSVLLYVALAIPAARKVTFNNNCNSDVWISPITGAAGNCPCPQGTSCNTANNICYYDTPTPSRGNWRVPVGQSSQITFPYYNWNDGDRSSFWNGNFAFCLRGTACSKTEQACDSSGCSSSGPANLVEFNLLKKISSGGPDFYDISNIFGVNVPVSITADGYGGAAGQAYTCGSPGSLNPISGLGASNWQLNAPSADYQWVSPANPPQTCSTPSNCPSGQTCGVIYTPQGQIERVCGALSGYWTPYRVCADQASTSVFSCSDAALNNLYQCAGSSDSSCYQPGASASCCGCADWQDIFGSNVVPSYTDRCMNKNSQWTSRVLPTLQWLKKACPSCYTYPYDDKSSTFICGNADSAGYNNQAYTVTFCPAGGATSFQGLPTSGASSSTATTSGSSSSTGGQSTSGCGSGMMFCPNAGGTGQCYNPSAYVCSGSPPYLCPSSAPHAINGGCSA
eukprot:Phypoly_transcript_07792.p1 GENE.Phypoly_transcript_07792~~Phypoly_transcript_07792.p1  ORF type:complete len:460 (+),score=50.64 Phypoly_transcript_07792:153-1532(+)